MKKKSLCFFVIVLIIANVFLSTTPVKNNQSQLTLSLLEARADEAGEDDPTDPGDEFPPLRPSPTYWILTGVTDYFF